MNPRIGVAVAASIVLACGGGQGDEKGITNSTPTGLPSCASTAVFTVPPVPAASILGWVPLGNLNPPGHTFPTDHQYIYLQGFNTAGLAPVPLVAPGNITVTGARRTSYSTGNLDYALRFMACAEVSAEFGHVTTLSDALLSKLGVFDQQCESYSPQPGLTVQSCFTKPAKIELAVGDAMGTTKGLDLSLFDSRVPEISYANPARWTRNSTKFDHFHVVPFSDYYAEPARTTIAALVGAFNGQKKRTVAPIGGSIASDVPGTVQGSWISPGAPTYPESPHLAITPDAVDPSIIAVSAGTSLAGLASSVTIFTPGTGSIDHAPASITPGSGVHCWETWRDSHLRAGVVLVQFVDASSLKIEARPGASTTCASEQPWSFTSAATSYVR